MLREALVIVANMADSVKVGMDSVKVGILHVVLTLVRSWQSTKLGNIRAFQLLNKVATVDRDRKLHHHGSG